MHAPLVRHRFVVALAALAMLALPVGQAAASVPTGKPITIQVDDTFVAPKLTANCGFEVTLHEYGTIRETEDPDTGAFLDRVALKRTFSGPGGSVTFPVVGLDTLLSRTIDGNIQVDVVASIGVNAVRWVIPGHGIVFANIGRDVFRITVDLSTGEELDFVFLEDAGLNLDLTDEALAIICDYLAG